MQVGILCSLVLFLCLDLFPKINFPFYGWKSSYFRFNLTEAEALPKCTGQEKLTRRQYKQDSKIQFVYDSVYAMAYALDKLLRHDCSNLSDFRSCAKRLNIDGQRFYKEYILNVSFVGEKFRCH